MLSGALRGLRAVRSVGVGRSGLLHKSLPGRSSLFYTGQGLSAESRGTELICSAKKAKKKKKAKPLKTSPIPQRAAEPWTDVDTIMLLLLLVESYSRETGKPLMDDAEITNIASEVFNAPFCLMANDYTGDETVTVTYANKAALAMLCAPWDEVVGQPFTLFERDTLEKGMKEGHLTGLSAEVNVSDGSQVELKEVNLVNISNPSGTLWIIMFDKWLLEDGTEVGPGYIPPSQIPSDEEMAEAKERVDSLAAAVRDLKENQGMTNTDEAVKEAVAELLAAKEVLAKLEDTIAAAESQ